MTSLTTIAKQTPVQRFTKQFQADGWLLINDGKKNESRLINRYSGVDPSCSYISEAYCRELYADKTEAGAVEAYVKKALPLVTGSIFLPLGQEIVRSDGSNWYNSYQTYVPKFGAALPPPRFLEFFERMFPNPLERHIIIQWLAHMFQKPNDRPSWHLLMVSDAGTGKGFLVEHILTPLLMNQTTIVKKYSELLGKFSLMLSIAMLILLDDTKTSRDETTTQLKSLLSEERAYIEEKRLSGSMKKVFARIILASNEDRPLALDEDDRRWFAPKRITHKVSTEETSQFIALLAADLAIPGAMDRIYHYFMQYSLDDFNHKHIEQSDQLKIIIGLRHSALDEFVSDYGETNKAFKLAHLKGDLKEARIDWDDVKLVRSLEKSGFKNARLLINGVRGRFWFDGKLSNDEAIAIVKSSF